MTHSFYMGSALLSKGLDTQSQTNLQTSSVSWCLIYFRAFWPWGSWPWTHLSSFRSHMSCHEKTVWYFSRTFRILSLLTGLCDLDWLIPLVCVCWWGTTHSRERWRRQTGCTSEVGRFSDTSLAGSSAVSKWSWTEDCTRTHWYSSMTLETWMSCRAARLTPSHCHQRNDYGNFYWSYLKFIIIVTLDTS